MSRAPWDREPTTGLPKKTFQQIDEEFRRADGSLNIDLFPDCNVWNQTSAAWLACGWRNVARIAETMVADPSYPWRLITDGTGSDHPRNAQQYSRTVGKKPRHNRAGPPVRESEAVPRARLKLE